MNTKARKPRVMSGSIFAVALGSPLVTVRRVSVRAMIIDIDDAKRLRAWLDKAIAWMEGGR